MNPDPTIHDLFDTLDRWRHLPDYQLERRADIFFALYLAAAVEQLTGVEVAAPMIPEFPLRKGTLWGEDRRDRNLSVKVDYALLSADRSTAYFVELKTDDGSRRDAQDAYLEQAKLVGFRKLVRGVQQIAMATKAHQKYHHLLAALSRHGAMQLPADLEAVTFPTQRRGLSKRLEEIEITVNEDEFEIEVLYVQPTLPDEVAGFGFEDFARFVEDRDELGAVFAKYLRRWTTAAGSALP